MQATTLPPVQNPSPRKQYLVLPGDSHNPRQNIWTFAQKTYIEPQDPDPNCSYLSLLEDGSILVDGIVYGKKGNSFPIGKLYSPDQGNRVACNVICDTVSEEDNVVVGGGLGYYDERGRNILDFGNKKFCKQ